MGYAGGTSADPTYRRMGDHTECIQVDYDSGRITYDELLDTFFSMHNPSRRAYSRQYASLVLYETAEERDAAISAAVRFSELLGKPVLTEIAPLQNFYPAEDYHQKYGLRGDKVLMGEFKRFYSSEESLRESTAAARVNGFAYAGGPATLLDREIDSYGLSEVAAERLKGLAGRT